MIIKNPPKYIICNLLYKLKWNNNDIYTVVLKNPTICTLRLSLSNSVFNKMYKYTIYMYIEAIFYFIGLLIFKNTDQDGENLWLFQTKYCCNILRQITVILFGYGFFKYINNISIFWLKTDMRKISLYLERRGICEHLIPYPLKTHLNLKKMYIIKKNQTNLFLRIILLIWVIVPDVYDQPTLPRKPFNY